MIPSLLTHQKATFVIANVNEKVFANLQSTSRSHRLNNLVSIFVNCKGIVLAFASIIIVHILFSDIDDSDCSKYIMVHHTVK